MTRTRAEVRSASSAMLAALALLTVSLFLFLAPYHHLLSWTSGRGTPHDRAYSIAALAAPVMVLVAVALIGHAGAFRGRARLRNTLPASAEPALSPWPDLLARLDALQVGVRTAGDPTKVVDPGGRALLSPHLVRNPFGRGAVIVVPALAWLRLASEPPALAAVVAHELGHAEHRDLQAIVLLEGVLVVTLLVTAAIVAWDLAASLRVDLAAPGGASAALLANLAGKASNLALVGLAAVAMVVVRATQGFREAMADQYAVGFVGDEALDAAEARLGGAVHGGADRPWRRWPIDRIAAWPPLLLALGFAASAFQAYVASPLAFSCQAWPGSTACEVSTPIYNVLRLVIAFGAAFAVSSVAQALRGDTRHAPVDLLWLSVGWVAGFLVSQTVPLSLTSLPVFDRFPNLLRHDAGPLLLSDAMQSLVVVAQGGCVALAAASGRGPRLLWVAGGLAALVAGPLAIQASASSMAGFVGPLLVCLFLLASIASTATRSRQPVSWPGRLAGGLGLAVLLGGWMGLGGPSYPALGFERAAQERLAQKQNAQAIIDLRRAARLAPFSASGWFNLADGIDPGQSGRPEAIAAADRALHAPYLHAWAQKADILVLAGSLKLAARRDANDWAGAERDLTQALRLWRGSTRLEDRVGLVSLYNLAIVDVHRHGDRIGAALRLVEAVNLKPEVARLLGDDPDLTPLRILDTPPPTAETAQRLQERARAWTTFRTVARAAGVSDEQAYRFLALLLRCQARDAGVNAACSL